MAFLPFGSITLSAPAPVTLTAAPSKLAAFTAGGEVGSKDRDGDTSVQPDPANGRIKVIPTGHYLALFQAAVFVDGFLPSILDFFLYHDGKRGYTGTQVSGSNSAPIMVNFWGVYDASKYAVAGALQALEVWASNVDVDGQPVAVQIGWATLLVLRLG